MTIGSCLIALDFLLLLLLLLSEAVVELAFLPLELEEPCILLKE